MYVTKVLVKMDIDCKGFFYDLSHIHATSYEVYDSNYNMFHWQYDFIQREHKKKSQNWSANKQSVLTPATPLRLRQYQKMNASKINWFLEFMCVVQLQNHIIYVVAW